MDCACAASMDRCPVTADLPDRAADRERACQSWMRTMDDFVLVVAADRLRRGVLTVREIGDVIEEAWQQGWDAAASAEPLPEWCCPSCGATTRAPMADRQGERR